jgi:hypothetical protein
MRFLKGMVTDRNMMHCFLTDCDSKCMESIETLSRKATASEIETIKLLEQAALLRACIGSHRSHHQCKVSYAAAHGKRLHMGVLVIPRRSP